MSDAATAEAIEADPFAELDGGEETTEISIPDFKKMKKGEIVEWVKENVEEGDIPDGFFESSVKEMRASLAAAFASEDDVTAPSTTGFDVNDLIHKTVAEIEAIKGEEEAKQAVLDLMDESEFSFFKVGGILARFKAEGWTGEFDTFADFVESEFGFKIRKAETLILIYQSLISCGAPWAEAKEVGWAKLGVIAKHLTPDNWGSWFKQVKEVSHAAVVQMAKDANSAKKNGDDSGNVPDSTPQKKLSIVIHEDQAENIQDAFDKAKDKLGTKYDGQALHAIALDYLSTPEPAAAPAAQTVSEEDEEEQDAVETLTGLFNLMRESGTIEECAEAIIEAMSEAFPELVVEISSESGDDSED